jgi:dimethylargininase
LKSAATTLDSEHVLCNPEWIDAAIFEGLETVAIDPSEPHAANALRIGSQILVAAAHVRTAGLLRARGYRVCAVDVSELAKAEAGVTCCSLLV